MSNPSPSRDLGLGSIAGRTPPEELQEHAFDPAESAGFFLGVRQFSNDAGLTEIPFAVDDAIDLAWLFAVELALVRPKQIVICLGGEPCKPATATKLAHLRASGAAIHSAKFVRIHQVIEATVRQSGPRGMLICALATHGFQSEGVDYFLAEDSIRAKLTRTAVSVREVEDDLGRSASKRQLVLIDACREQVDDAKSRRVGGGMSPALVAALGKAEGRVVLSAAAAGGFAYDDPTLGNGVFTAAIIDGLRDGTAAGDDGFVRATELAAFVGQRVVQWVRDNQPHMAHQAGIQQNISGGGGDLPLAIHPERYRAGLALRQMEKLRRQDEEARIEKGLGSLIACLGLPGFSGQMVDDIRLIFRTQRDEGLRAGLLRRLERLADSPDEYPEVFAAWWEIHGAALLPKWSRPSSPPFAPPTAAPQTTPAHTAVPLPPGVPQPPAVPPPPVAIPDPVIAAPAAAISWADVIVRPKRSRFDFFQRHKRLTTLLILVCAFSLWYAFYGPTRAALLRAKHTGQQDESRFWVTLRAMTEVSPALRSKKANAEALLPDLGPNGAPGHRVLVELPSGPILTMLWCPPGAFAMGSPPSEVGRAPDEAQYVATITKGFWISATEVSQSDWLAIMGEIPPQQVPFQGPVANVSWNAIMGKQSGKKPRPKRGSFMAELNFLTGGTFTLPSEAQWEYACRGGTTMPWYHGTTPKRALEAGWTSENVPRPASGGAAATQRSTGRYPGPWGSYDMHGNAMEWCLDNYGPYPSVATADPLFIDHSPKRVVRGGSVRYDMFRSRSASRGSLGQTNSGPDVSFRVVMNP